MIRWAAKWHPSACQYEKQLTVVTCEPHDDVNPDTTRLPVHSLNLSTACIQISSTPSLRYTSSNWSRSLLHNCTYVHNRARVIGSRKDLILLLHTTSTPQRLRLWVGSGESGRKKRTWRKIEAEDRGGDEVTVTAAATTDALTIVSTKTVSGTRATTKPPPAAANRAATPPETAKMLLPPGTYDNLRLAGKGDRLIGLVLKQPPPSYQWAQWLRLPLASAATQGDAAAVMELLAAGADGKAGPRGSDGSTLLHCAARGGSERVVTALLQAGSVPDVDQPVLTDNEERPLHIAARLGHSGVASALINAGANVDCRDRNCWTPLHLAARFGEIEVVNRLLQEGADRGAEDVNGYKPLHFASMWSHTATIAALVRAGADLESATRVDGNRPLHIAARYANAATVQTLLREGADRDARNSRGLTALHAAAAADKGESLKLLIEAGASVNLPSAHQGFTPLHLAARRGAVEACSHLLAAGALIGARALDGSTPLHLACALLKVPAARLLLCRGANGRVLDDAKQTPADLIEQHLAAYSEEAGAGGSRGGRNSYHPERQELVAELRSLAADMAWARRGWLIMARARLLPERRQPGSRDVGRRGIESPSAKDGDRCQRKSGDALAIRSVAAAAADGLVGDKSARRGDAAGEAEEPREKCPRRASAFRGAGGDAPAVADDPASSSLDLVTGVAGLKEDNIFQNIVSFL